MDFSLLIQTFAVTTNSATSPSALSSQQPGTTASPAPYVTGPASRPDSRPTGRVRPEVGYSRAAPLSWAEISRPADISSSRHPRWRAVILQQRKQSSALQIRPSDKDTLLQFSEFVFGSTSSVIRWDIRRRMRIHTYSCAHVICVGLPCTGYALAQSSPNLTKAAISTRWPLTRWERAESARNPIAAHVKFGDDCAHV